MARRPCAKRWGTTCSELTLDSTASGIYSAPGLTTCCVFAKRGEPENPSARPLSFAIKSTSGEPAARLELMLRHGQPLGHSFAVQTGIQSGADRLTPRHRQQVGLDDPLLDGIFVLGHEQYAALAPRLNAAEHALLKPLGKSPQVGPFVYARPPDCARLLYLDGQVPLEQLPNLAAHLAPFRALLSARRECRLGRMALVAPALAATQGGFRCTEPSRAAARLAYACRAGCRGRL